MQALLLALYPKVWREQYGAEYKALLEDTGMSVATVLDSAKAACLLRLTAHGRTLNILAATSLYTLSGVTCIHLGLTDNWPIWAPTTPLRAAGLVITLMPLAYALYLRFSVLRKHKQRWRGNSMHFWLVASPFTATSTLLLAFMYGFFFMSTGLFGVRGGIPFVCGTLGMAGVSVGLVKFLNSLQSRLLRRIAIR